MKSYLAHLSSLTSEKPSHVTRKASCIFPLIDHPKISFRLLFLNYWKIKRKISEIHLQMILRNEEGRIVRSESPEIRDEKGYLFEMSDYLPPSFHSGSVEMIFSSEENIVFPYPAVVIEYYNETFSSFVHAAQRVFNNTADTEINRRENPVESGFNIYCTNEIEPFLTLINGPDPVHDEILVLSAYNRQGKVLSFSEKLSLQPYSCRQIFQKDSPSLAKHLNGEAGCLKINIRLPSIFPRFIVGNRHRTDSFVSLTHTYYDLSPATGKEDYWTAPDDSRYPASLFVPIREDDLFFTHIYFYPIYSPGSFWIDTELYDRKGNLLERKEKVLYPSSGFSRLSPAKHPRGSALRLIARSETEIIPARIKVGLDIGYKGRGLPCNICTNFQPANPSLSRKPSTFRWAPFPSRRGSVICLNEAPLKTYARKADVLLTCYRVADTKVLRKQIEIPPYGSVDMGPNEELSDFFSGKPGWCTFESRNPFITTYYFSESPSSGVVGGDHGF